MLSIWYSFHICIIRAGQQEDKAFGKRLQQRCTREHKADPLRVQQVSLDFLHQRSERRGDFSCDGVILYHTLAKDGALPSGYETEFAARAMRVTTAAEREDRSHTSPMWKMQFGSTLGPRRNSGRAQWNEQQQHS